MQSYCHMVCLTIGVAVSLHGRMLWRTDFCSTDLVCIWTVIQHYSNTGFKEQQVLCGPIGLRSSAGQLHICLHLATGSRGGESVTEVRVFPLAVFGQHGGEGRGGQCCHLVSMVTWVLFLWRQTTNNGWGQTNNTLEIVPNSSTKGHATQMNFSFTPEGGREGVGNHIRVNLKVTRKLRQNHINNSSCVNISGDSAS